MLGMDLGLKQRTALAMTPALRQAIGFMAMSNADLSARLADLAQQNALMRPTVGAQGDGWLTLVRQIAPPPADGGGGRKPPATHSGAGGMATDRIAQAGPGLIAHVEAQLPLLLSDPADRAIARHFLLALEPTGWLGAPMDEIAADAGCPPERAEAVLQRLQGAEPTGLFARNLAECLSLQAREEGLLTPAFATLLAHLPLLAAGEIEALATVCDCPVATVQTMARALRGLNPKPGSAFGDDAIAAPRTVDLILHRDGAGWLIEMNAASVPVLHLAAPTGSAPTEAAREARALAQAVERRHATVLAIAAEIVARQDAHLRGTAPLAAVTINDLAAATGLHRSTVSRVTAAIHLSHARRSLRLRDLMCAAAPPARRQEAPLSVAAVLARIGALVAAEDPARPLTDDQIGRLLLPDGAALARRTVAKYRTLAGIAPRAQRRRKA